MNLFQNLEDDSSLRCSWNEKTTSQVSCMQNLFNYSWTADQVFCCTGRNTTVFSTANCEGVDKCQAQWSGWSGWQEAEYEPVRNRSRFYHCDGCSLVDTEFIHLTTLKSAERFCGYNKVRDAHKNCDDLIKN